ncbi:MAG: NAD-dependent epimerase/dehydratase family protein [Myxococcales bacterium]|nr:NAD-dependent epimerase/dehydratase family protein [Myxococcales bacterium]MCB9748382.1 NAD-dependent epimerase/dehydratase family protein [Myxococcales bacterium]
MKQDTWPLDRRRFLRLGAGALGALAAGACASKQSSGESPPPGGASAPPPEDANTKTYELRPVERGHLLVLGGTGFLGPHTVRAALARGHTVTLFNRGKTNPELFPELEKLRGDRKTGDLAALKGRRFDAVIDTSGYYPRVVTEVAQLLADTVDQYLFVSTVSVYADTSQVGMDERAPLAEIEDKTSEQVTGETYGALKALCEQAAEAVFAGRTSVVRPGLIVGPGDPTDRFTYWPVRVARGGDVLSPGSPEDPVQIIDARDLAEWMIDAIEQRHLGVYNAVGPAERLSVGAMLEACKQAGESDARFVWADAEFLAEQEVTPWQHMPVWVPPTGEYAGFGTVNAGRAIAAGMRFRPVVDTCRDTLSWWRELEPERQARLLEGKSAGISAARETEVLAAWRAHQKREKAGSKKVAWRRAPARPWAPLFA